MTTQNGDNLPNAPFNPLQAIAQERATRRRRHMPFALQCAINSARDMADRPTLARAFNVSETTVSLIANASLARKRYASVARELEARGRDQFDRLYYTEEIHARVMREKYGAITK